MKIAKRFFALLMAIALVMGLAVSASAVSITIDDKDITGATYKAYQLLTATNAVDENGDGTDKFAYGVTEKYKTVLCQTLGLPDTATDKEIINGIEAKRGNIQNFANVLYANIQDAGLEADETTTTNTFENQTQGYYLIVESAVSTDDEGDVYSLVMLDTAGHDNITVQTKEERPTLEKIISADDNQIGGDIDDGGKSDNVSVGSHVEFTLTATVPSHAQYYDYYYFIIDDTLSEGLTFVNDEHHPLTVSVGTTPLVAGTDYILYTGDNAEGKTFQIAMLNAKDHAGKTITVKYWATLNEKAVIGEDVGNTNTADLTYSNNPNFSYLPDNGNPPPSGKPAEDSDIPLGNTPDAITRTYTTGIQLIKVDQEHEPLTGAVFTVTGDNIVKVLTVTGTTYVADTNGDFWRLKDGTYTNVTPHNDQYVKITDGTRTGGYVKRGENFDVASKEQLADSNIQLYKLSKGSISYYANTTTKYKVASYSYVVKDPTGIKTYQAAVDEHGYLVLAGLGEGTYTITETQTPAGYNTVDPITVVISWEPPKTEDGTDCTWQATMNGNTVLSTNAQGLFELEIVNEAGAELPETGGMGTTLIYVVGGILFAAAVVLLVTKKRMSEEE